LVDLEKVAFGRKPVPDEFINRQSNFVTPEFLEYVRPLIGGSLPEYVHLRRKVLEKRLPAYAQA